MDTTHNSSKEEMRNYRSNSAGDISGDLPPSSSTPASIPSSTSSRMTISKPRKRNNQQKDTNAALTQPIYDLIDEIFELHERGWVRRQATWAAKQIVRLTFNGAINTFISEKVSYMTSESQVSIWIDWITSLVWPGGKLFTSGESPTEDDIKNTKEAARSVFLKSLPSSYQILLGKAYCSKGMNKMFQFCQIEPLVKHLGYRIVDCLIMELFPELEQKKTKLDRLL